MEIKELKDILQYDMWEDFLVRKNSLENKLDNYSKSSTINDSTKEYLQSLIDLKTGALKGYERYESDLNKINISEYSDLVDYNICYRSIMLLKDLGIPIDIDIERCAVHGLYTCLSWEKSNMLLPVFILGCTGYRSITLFKQVRDIEAIKNYINIIKIRIRELHNLSYPSRIKEFIPGITEETKNEWEYKRERVIDDYFKLFYRLSNLYDIYQLNNISSNSSGSDYEIFTTGAIYNILSKEFGAEGNEFDHEEYFFSESKNVLTKRREKSIPGIRKTKFYDNIEYV